MGWEGGQLPQERTRWADRLSLTVWFSRNVVYMYAPICPPVCLSINPSIQFHSPIYPSIYLSDETYSILYFSS